MKPTRAIHLRAEASPRRAVEDLERRRLERRDPEHDFDGEEHQDRAVDLLQERCGGAVLGHQRIDDEKGDGQDDERPDHALDDPVDPGARFVEGGMEVGEQGVHRALTIAPGIRWGKR